MKNSIDMTFRDNKIYIAGAIQFTNVMSLYQQSLTTLDTLSEWIFDLSGVTSSASAGVALLIEWQKLAKQKNKRVRFECLPEKMISIATASKLDSNLML